MKGSIEFYSRNNLSFLDVLTMQYHQQRKWPPPPPLTSCYPASNKRRLLYRDWCSVWRSC